MSDPDNSLHFNSFIARGYLPLQNTEIFSTVRNRKISLGKCLISFTFLPEHTLRVHVRTASARRFLRASTVQVSVTYQYSYEISLSFVRRIKANVLRTYVVCMAHEMYA